MHLELEKSKNKNKELGMSLVFSEGQYVSSDEQRNKSGKFWS